MSVDDVFAVSVEGSIISMSGDLDAHTAPQLDAAVDSLMSSGDGDIVLEMESVGFVDSSGLRSMIRARNDGGDDRQVIIRSPSAATLRLLEVTGMTDHFTIDLGA